MEIAIGNGTMEDLINSLKDKYINSIMLKDINDILKSLPRSLLSYWRLNLNLLNGDD